jgi:hypothetical protein
MTFSGSVLIFPVIDAGGIAFDVLGPDVKRIRVVHIRRLDLLGCVLAIVIRIAKGADELTINNTARLEVIILLLSRA